MKLVSRVCFLPIITFLASLTMIAGAVRGDVAGEIEQVVNDKLLDRAAVGIDVVKLGKSSADVASVYRANETMPLVPASNLKVITTSTALDELGADFKFRTQLVYHNG